MALNSPIFNKIMSNMDNTSSLASTSHLRQPLPTKDTQTLGNVYEEPNILDSGLTPNPVDNTDSPSISRDLNLSMRNARNNSPGNIKDFGIKWEGMSGADSGGDVASGSFVKFKSPEYGARALAKDISTKRKRGLNTIGKILPVYAPNGRENDTKSYINSVVKSTGINSDQVLTDKDMFKVMKAITAHEGGQESLKYFTDDILKSGLQMAGY